MGFQIDKTSERHRGTWGCADCEMKGESREAFVLAAKHARATGHKAGAQIRSSIVYFPADREETPPIGLSRVPEPNSPKAEEAAADRRALLDAVAREQGRRWMEYGDDAGIHGARLIRARDSLLESGEIVVMKRHTGASPKKVLVLGNTEAREFAVA